MTRVTSKFFRQVAWPTMVLIFVLGVVAPVVSAQASIPQPQQPGACSPPSQPLGTGAVSVQGWVINHREQAVDGTRTSIPLRIDAISSAGTVISAKVDSNGFYKLALTPDVWNFSLQLPTDWDGIVPLAPRGGLAIAGCTPLTRQRTPYAVVFKIRRLFDVTAQKWEELAGGAVQPGAGWQITFQPINDPFAIQQTRITAGDGKASFTVTPGAWLVYEWYRPGWSALTPPQVTFTLDEYAAPGPASTVVFKNQKH